MPRRKRRKQTERKKMRTNSANNSIPFSPVQSPIPDIVSPTSTILLFHTQYKNIFSLSLSFLNTLIPLSQEQGPSSSYALRPSVSLALACRRCLQAAMRSCNCCSFRICASIVAAEVRSLERSRSNSARLSAVLFSYCVSAWARKKRVGERKCQTSCEEEQHQKKREFQKSALERVQV